MRNTLAIAFILPIAANLGGCGDGHDTSPRTAARDVTVTFAAATADGPVHCAETLPDIGVGPAPTLRLDDFRFYVSEVTLLTGDGTEVPVVLTDDGVWQSQGVALLDFEDGCAGGTPQTNDSIHGSAELPAGTAVEGLCFTLGVPFALNHLDPVTQPSPLNASGMFWNWQGGYKFLRIDAVGDPDNRAVGFNVHLGSTGCTSAGATTPPGTECRHPNRPRVCLSPFDPDQDRVVARLDRLLEDTDVTVNTPDTAPGCMSANADPECIAILPKLGLDFVYDDGVNPPVVYPAAEPQRFFVRAGS